MTERSKEMIEQLLEKGVGDNPIVWVGHSKGGLFIKQILVDGKKNNVHKSKVENFVLIYYYFFLIRNSIRERM